MATHELSGSIRAAAPSAGLPSKRPCVDRMGERNVITRPLPRWLLAYNAATLGQEAVLTRAECRIERSTQIPKVAMGAGVIPPSMRTASTLRDQDGQLAFWKWQYGDSW